MDLDAGGLRLSHAQLNLGDVQVDRIKTADLIGALKPICSAKPETANRVRQRIEAVIDDTSALGIRSGDNPARCRGHLDHLLPEPKKRVARSCII
ncbi:MAG: hypothetical protein AAFQ18_12020 [Pseudomonadota bacterium]